MGTPENAEPPLEFVGRIEGSFDAACRFVGKFKVDPDPSRLGVWEYVAVARAPGHDVAGRTTTPLTVTVDGDRLRIAVQVDPDAPDSFDDRVTLEGEDGYCRTLSLVSQAKMHAHERGMTTVIFEGVKAGVRYTCTVDPGRQGPPYKPFVNLELKPEHLLPK